MFLLPGVELDVEESVSDDLKTVYKHPVPLISTFLPAEGWVRQGCDRSGQGQGLSARLPSLNRGSRLLVDGLWHITEPSEPQFLHLKIWG